MQKINWVTIRKPIAELLPADYNPRKIQPEEMEHLQESLEKFDVADPIIINSNNRIIGGHQRLKALQAKGIKEVDCRAPSRELTLDEEKELNLRLNRNAGEWDWPLLVSFGEDMIKNVGFSSAEIDKIFATKPEPKDDDVPELHEIPKTILGDIYQLGKHRLMCGNSTMFNDVEKLMNGQKASIGLTDPPYGVRKEEDWDNKENFIKSLDDWFHNYRSFSEKGLVWFCAGKMLPYLVTREGFERLLIWNKPAGSQFAGASNNNLWYSNEPILVFDYDGIKKNCGTINFSYSVFDSRTIPKSNYSHPTSKPIDLMVWLLEHYSISGQIVIDLFLGSGSTLIACEKMNRICYGMEIDPKYCDVIIKRFEDFTGQKAVRL